MVRSFQDTSRTLSDFIFHRLACKAAEPDVVHTGIDHLRLARRWTISQAVVGGTQVRAAFDNFARNPELRLRPIVTLVWRGNARIDRGTTASFDHFIGVAPDEPITSPFPYVSCHVVQTVAVRRKGSDRGCSLVSVMQ